MSLPKWSVNQFPAAKEWCQSVCEHAVSLRGNRSNFRRSSINVTYLTASWHSFVFYWRYIRNTVQLFAAVSLRSVRASVTFNFRSSQSVHPSVELPHQMEVYKIAYWFIFTRYWVSAVQIKAKRWCFIQKKKSPSLCCSLNQNSVRQFHLPFHSQIPLPLHGTLRTFQDLGLWHSDQYVTSFIYI